MFWHGLSHLKNKSAGSIHGLQTLREEKKASTKLQLLSINKLLIDFLPSRQVVESSNNFFFPPDLLH